MKKTISADTSAVETAVHQPAVEKDITEAPAVKDTSVRGVPESSSQKAWENQQEDMKEIKPIDGLHERGLRDDWAERF